MSVSARVYGQAPMTWLNKEVDILSDDIKLSLHTSSYVPNQDTHVYKSDLTNEVSGTGYTAGGQSLANKTLTYTAATNTIKFDADDVSWDPVTVTARVGVITDVTPGSDATRPLIAYLLSTADVSTTAGLFLVRFHASGIVNIFVS